MNYGGYFDIEGKIKKVNDLDAMISSSNFWLDKDKAEKIISEKNTLKNIIDDIVNVRKSVKSNIELYEMIDKEFDSEIKVSLENETKNLLTTMSTLEVALLLNGPYDKLDCVLEIHAGAGGTEACDWAMMLFRMYTRWCDNKKYKYEIIDFQDGEEVGCKSASILVKGINSYGYLKNEKGIHRLVRLSPFDANHKRHTSFASIDVTPNFDNNIDIDIKETDLKIDVFRSSGAGGQSVNTTDSAVRITHLPTKIVVTCQNERSQIQNREMAMQMLRNKLMLVEIEKQQEKLNQLKGEHMGINFGSQIRSYVMHPYSMVKDHRTDAETSNVIKVLDGDIDMFIESNLKDVQ